ncbi:MAG: oligosaccharide flippase family protein, partial [Gemmatimonadetes bacterium]|nr:oligosaccharide flippase family protein [Gemmatimonadota bacterium]
MTTPPTPPRGAIASLVEQVRERIGGEGVTGSAFRSFMVNVGGAGISFIGQVILARALGQEGFGVYLLALACMNAASVLAKMELDGTSTRFLAGYIGAEQWSHARGYATWSRRVVRWTSMGVAAIGVAIAWVWRAEFAAKHEALPAALMVVAGLLVMNAQMLLNSSYLQALKRYVQSQVPGLVLRPALLAATVGAWLLLG